MTINLPCGIFCGRISTFGPRILLLTRKWRDEDREGYRVQACNFSRWGRRNLVQVRSGEKETMLVLNTEKIWPTDEYINRAGNTRGLGDCIVGCGVSDSLEPLKHAEDSCLVREDFGLP